MFTVLDRESQRMKTCIKQVIRPTDRYSQGFGIYAYILENAEKTEGATVWN